MRILSGIGAIASAVLFAPALQAEVIDMRDSAPAAQPAFVAPAATSSQASQPHQYAPRALQNAQYPAQDQSAPYSNQAASNQNTSTPPNSKPNKLNNFVL